MKPFILLVSVILFVVSSPAQIEFQTTLHHGANDVGVGIDISEDGGFIVAGTIFPGNNGGTDISLSKLSSTGEVQWKKVAGGSGDDNVYEIRTVENGYILLGTTYGFDSPMGAIQIIKFDQAGEVLWSRIYNDLTEVSSYGLQIASNGDYLLTGYVGSVDTQLDHVVIRMNEDGDEIWKKVFGTTEDDLGGGILELNDGSFVFTSSTLIGGDGDISIHRLTSNGDLIWSKRIPGNVHGSAYTIDLLDNGNIILIGETHETIGPDDTWLVEVDVNGQVAWSKVYGLPDKQLRSLSGEVTVDGNIAVCMYDYTAADSQMGLLLTDAEGNVLWFRTYTSSFFSQSRTVKETADGGFVIAGMILNGAQSDMIIIKTDSEGNTCGAFSTATITSQDWPTGSTTYVPEIYEGTTMTTVLPESSDDLSLVSDMICTTGGTGVDEMQNTNELFVYPNPAYSLEEVFIAGSSGQIRIYDQTGKECSDTLRITGTNGCTITPLSAGIYTVMDTNGKYRISKRLIVVE